MQQHNWLDNVAIAITKVATYLNWLVVILAIVGAGFIAQHAMKLEFDNNYRAFFSPENPELRNFEEFQSTYTKSDNFVFVIVPNDGSDIFTNENLAAIGALTEMAWQIPYANRADSITNFQYTYAEDDDLIVEDLVPAPGQSSDADLRIHRARALGEPLLNGQLINADATATSINVVLQYPEVSLEEVPQAVAAARAIRDKIEAAYPQTHVYLSGTTMLNNAFSEAVKTDFAFLVPVMIVIILLVTALAVRSVWATFATLILVILSSMVAMGWAGFVGIKLAGPSPSAVIVILTLAIADSIHILISVRGAMRIGMEKREAIIEAIRINFLAVSITSITTIVGFMALNFSDSPPFRDFGNISAVGILAAWFFSLTLLPALLSIIPLRVPARTHMQEEPGFLSGFADFVIRYYGVFFVLSGVSCIALISLIPRNIYSDEFRKYFDQRIEFRTDTDEIVNYFGFNSLEFSIAADGPGSINDPDYLVKLDAFATWLKDHRFITHVSAIPDIMKRLNKNLNGDNPEFYRLPENRELAAQYLLLFELSLPYGLDLNDRINIDKSASRVTATLDGNVSTQDTRIFIQEIDAWFSEHAPEMRASPTGPQVMFTFIAQRNIESMVEGTAIAIALIAIIMIIALRSFSIGLLSIAPNLLPILCAFGAWALLRGEIGFAAAAVASLSLGIVIDDTVHFLTKFTRARREKEMTTADSIRYAFQTVGVAILVNTIILTSGFMILTLSAFKINVELGLLTSLSIGFALILDFLFLPALLLIIAKVTGEKFSIKKEDAHVVSIFSQTSFKTDR